MVRLSIPVPTISPLSLQFQEIYIALGRTMKKLLLSSAIALTTSDIALAMEKPLETMIVSATRTEQSIDDVMASVTLLTREDIERIQAQDLYDVLSQVPGLNMHRTGGAGSTISVVLRGTSTNQTLFLLNGQRFASATLASPRLESIDPSQIERIEVVKGPRASLYGADAVGGVIHIFTKQAQQQAELNIESGFGGDLFAGGANHLRQKHRVAFTTGLTDTLAASVDLLHEATSGIDDTVSQRRGAEDKDANRTSGVSLSLVQDFEKGQIKAQYLFNKTHTEYDSGDGCSNIVYGRNDCQPFSDKEVESLNLSADYDVSDVLSLSGNIGFTKDLSETGDDLNNDPTQVFSVSNVFETKRVFTTAQADILLSEGHLLTLGADYYDDKIDGHVYVNGGVFGAPAARSGYLDENGDEINSRDNLAFFAQYQADFGAHSFVVGVREDDNEKYGHNTTGNIAWGYELNENLRVVASWGEAFRAPSFNDLYWPDGANANLEPEESETYELSLQGNYGDTRWEISYYETDVDSMIEWAPAPIPSNPFRWQPSNVESATIKGTELQISRELFSWQVAASYTHLDATYDKTVNGSFDGNQLQTRPEHTAKLDVSRSWGNFEFGVNWLAESSRTQHKSEEPETAGYGVVGIRTAYQLSKELKLQFKVDNLLDKDYTIRSYSFGFPSTWEDYNTTGRTAFLSVTYTPGL